MAVCFACGKRRIPAVAKINNGVSLCFDFGTWLAAKSSNGLKESDAFQGLFANVAKPENLK